MAPPVVSPERGAVAPDVLPFWGADHTACIQENVRTTKAVSVEFAKVKVVLALMQK